MPIKPENRHRYPADWKAIRASILDRAGHRCEGSPAYPECRAANYAPHPVTGSRVVLTIAHLDHTPEECDPARLRSWCQRCHLTYDAQHRKRLKQLAADMGVSLEMAHQTEQKLRARARAVVLPEGLCAGDPACPFFATHLFVWEPCQWCGWGCQLVAWTDSSAATRQLSRDIADELAAGGAK